MRLNRLDLNLLVALDALLTERSITRAAERIHLSQPATSGALARLREYFGDELLVRVGAQMKPTPLGESLANPVHNILMQIQATVERGIEFEAKESDRRFGFLMSDYSSTTLMPQLIRKLAKKAPRVQIEVFMATDNPAEQLEKGRVDFLLMPEFVKSESHPAMVIYKDDFVCLACAENPLTEKTLTLEKFMELGHVTVRFGNTRDKSQDQNIFARDYGIEPRIDIIASTFNAVPQYLPGTDRIATVYKRLAEKWCEFLPLKILPVPVEMPPIPWVLQWHQYRDLDPGIQWMRKMIQETVNELEN